MLLTIFDQTRDHSMRANVVVEYVMDHNNGIMAGRLASR